MTQPGLIKKILTATGLTDCNPNSTPAAQAPLGSDPDGEPMDESWSYSSVVGMLLYLATNTRPDISFAVSQAARFTHSPKKSHAKAVKTICRYLAGTPDKGTIFKPSQDFKLDCFVDADFAGLHGHEPQDSPNSARSRTGYLIFLCGCPLIWKSQLQTAIASSTFHAEYNALSAAIRVLLPIQNVLTEILRNVNHDTEPPTVHAEVFEDNMAAYILATKHQLTTRTRFLNINLHFFWQYVTDGTIKISKVDTKEQKSDILTKSLARDLFEAIRWLCQGW